MSTDKNNKSKNNQNKAEEPGAAYGEKKIKFFDSIEKMNEYDHQQYAKMTPEERLKAVCTMREAFWPEQQTTKPFGSHIHFE